MPVVPVLPPVATGVYTTSPLSALVAVSAFLQKPSMAELTQIVVQSIPNATFAPITFTSHTIDQDYLGGTGHSDSVNTSRYTSNFAGWYEVAGAIAYAANATGRRFAIWAVNGTNLSFSAIALPATTALATMIPARTKQIFLNVGDYVELMGYQESGVPLSTNVGGIETSGMSVRWVSN